MLGMAVLMAALVAPAQLLVGDMHGLNTQDHQPAKVAAMEGHFESQRGAPLILFGWPDMEAAETKYAVGIPKLGSLILKHDPDGEVIGLDAFPREDWPYVPVVFWAFRIMVGIGLLMILYGLVGAIQFFRKGLFESAWYHRWAVFMGPLGFVAVLAGWFVTEVGRQPYLVHGLLRTADVNSPIGAPGVAGSLLAFVLVYGLVFAAGTFYLLRLMRRPPEDVDLTPLRKGPLRSTGHRRALPAGEVNPGGIDHA
jgi:cytochrome d ubiquinol oxidase subunit I